MAREARCSIAIRGVSISTDAPADGRRPIHNDDSMRPARPPKTRGGVGAARATPVALRARGAEQRHHPVAHHLVHGARYRWTASIIIADPRLLISGSKVRVRDGPPFHRGVA